MYGMTVGGGSAGYGTLFSMSLTGTFSLLYSFLGGPGDGANPYFGSSLLLGATLFGLTEAGEVTILGCSLLTKSKGFP